MKKYLKSQTKKALSLILAVVMLMSCWVWIAPTEAEAANTAEEGYYQVRVLANNTDTADYGMSSHTWTVNGVSLTVNDFDLKTSGNDRVIASGWLSGFPSSWSGYGKTKDESACGATDCKARLENVRLQVYNNTNSTWVTVSGGEAEYFNFTEGGYTFSGPTITGQPEITTMTFTSASGSVTIPAIGKGTTASMTAVTGKIYDQYGVRFVSYVPDSYYLGGATADEKYANTEADGGYVSVTNGSCTVKINENFQINHLSKNTTAMHYLYATKTVDNTTVTGVYPITVTYPTYTVSINPNGQTGTTGAVMTMGDASTSTENWKTTGTYSSNGNATTYPTATATKTGYTFKGYWTNPQPTSGATSFNSFEADFATPVATAQYNSYAAAEGSDVTNGVVKTADGKLYCDGGAQWDPANRAIKGDITYYGWWIAEDINAKFYDIDGTYLGSKTFKYGSTPAAGEYPNPTETYNAGAFTYDTFSGTWIEIGGKKVTEGTYTFGIDGLKNLTLTPTYTTKTYKDKYAVKFVNPLNGGGLAGSTDYAYRYVLGSEIPGAAAVGMPNAMANDSGYTYEFIGWTTQVPANNANYHVIPETNTTFAVNTDWVVREDVTYYPVYRSFVKQYVIQFKYIDSTGTQVTKIEVIDYGSVITTPSYVNNTYASGGFGYNLLNWGYQGKTFDKDGALIFNKDNFTLAGNNLADGVDETPIEFVAHYDEGTPMPYTVTFKYKNDKGEDQTKTAEVYHDSSITQDTVNGLTVPGQYDDGEKLYTFSGKWAVTEGTAAEDEYETGALTSFSPTSHITFEALYDDGVPFYTVTYIDGPSTYSERILAGSNVPAWTYKAFNDNDTPDDDSDDYEEDIVYVPADRESETGTYKFVGWFDEAQTDAEYRETNGTQYTTADTVTGDLTLYSQFRFEAFKFTISFWSYDKSVQLAAGEYEYGQNFSDAFYIAQKAAQSRPADETYTYTFIGWDQPYNEADLICEGKDVEYVALYKPSYIYYKANWFGSEDDIAGEPLAVTKHTYGGKVYAPSVELTIDEGKAFDGWYYKDANGAEQSFVRGMTITADMNFYAKYKDAAITYTVTTVVGGVSTNYTVAKDDTADIIPNPAAGYVNETKHNKFDGWYTDADLTTAFDIANTKITGNITIYAKLTESAHELNNKEIIDVPTYYAEGKEASWCSCNPTNTRTEATIEMLTDTVAPTGTIYLGTQGKWSSTDKVGAASDTNVYYANDDTDLIITINDTGDINSAFNPSGVGKGIKTIRGFVSSDTFTLEQQGIASQLAQTIFLDETTGLNNSANFVVKVGDFIIADLDEDGEVQYEEDGTIKTKALEDGKTYIVYYYVVDKAGNVLNTKVRTAAFHYDITAPEFTVTGESNADKASSTPTYCITATVEDIEDGATVTVNGEAVTLTDGKYTINEAGNYLITVTDKAGNDTSKKIIVAADHKRVTSEKAVTCEEDGYKRVTCAVCDKVISADITTHEGHKWEVVKTVEATCTAGGYTLEKCSACGKERKTNEAEAIDHNYAKDENGDIIYTVVTKATCSTAGKKIANCTMCGGETITAEIPIDSDAHTYGGIKTLKATCTDTGEKYQNCKYCYDKKVVETIEATGHKETYKVVTIAATCGTDGEETEKCKKCDTVIDTTVIPATGKHIVYVDEKKEPTETEKGYIKYACRTCTVWTKTEEIDTLELYTVTFVGEDGTTEIEKFEDKVVGEAIAADAVTAPTKASDNIYDYTFAGWVDGDGNSVKLPYYVERDITLKATFSKATHIYTHKFMVPTEWTATYAVGDETYDEFATIMGAYGDTNKKPVAVPTLKDEEFENVCTFKFLGWSKSGAEGDIVTDFTMTGDTTFYAVFEAVANEYQVTYLNGTAYVWHTTVNGGESVEFDGPEPTKAYDNEYHYAFDKWYTDATCKTEYKDEAITADTRLYAGFTATAHSYDEANGTVTQEATCVLPELTEYACACGHKITEETNKALGHDPAPAVTEEVDGEFYSVVYCSVCGAEISRTKTTVTVAFKNWNGVRLDTQTLNVNEAIVYGDATPTRDADNRYTYTFAGWYVEGDKEETLVTLGNATADVTYIAAYTATTRTFRVTYVDVNNKAIQTTENIEYGAVVPEFTGNDPTKPYDDKNHYAFAGWDIAADATVTGDMMIKPVFTATKHIYTDVKETEATCTERGGMRYTCSCGHSYLLEGTVPALGHKFVEDEAQYVAPTYTTPGQKVLVCERCKETKTEVIPANRVSVTVTVKDTDGNPIKDARVTLVYAGTTNQVSGTKAQTTDANGQTKFYVEPGNYTAVIEGRSETANVTANEDGTSSGGNIAVQPEVQAPSCTCNCHKNSFWGIMFRLLHKFIKIFTGKINCCSCPDPRYFS